MTINFPPIRLRTFVRDFAGVVVYMYSWVALIVIPLITTVFLLVRSRILWMIPILAGFSILIGFLLRWIGKGIVQAKRFRSTIAGLCTLALGCLWILVGLDVLGSGSLAIGLQNITMGFLAVVGAIFLLFVAISPGSLDNHET